jgi:hypothetical protein
MLHAVNTQHGLQRIGPSAIARLGLKRLDAAVIFCHGPLNLLKKRERKAWFRHLLGAFRWRFISEKSFIFNMSVGYNLGYCSRRMNLSTT